MGKGHSFGRVFGEQGRSSWSGGRFVDGFQGSIDCLDLLFASLVIEVFDSPFWNGVLFKFSGGIRSDGVMQSEGQGQKLLCEFHDSGRQWVMKRVGSGRDAAMLPLKMRAG